MFHDETLSWKIMRLELDDQNALAMLRFKRKDDNKKSEVFLIRDVSKTNFYLNWKILHLI